MIDAAALTRLGINKDWARPLNDACGLFAIDTKGRESAFLAQCAHESEGMTRTVENLNYSPQGLLATFPKHFTPAESVEFAHDGQRIANRVYAWRNGNRNEASGDGWKYRGRGLLQITGRLNYNACGNALGVNLLESPELLEDHTHAALSAGWYWQSHGCNELADVGSFASVTKRINGGLNGQDDRLRWLAKTQAALA